MEDKTVIDIQTELNMVRYEERSRAVLRCRKTDDPQGIISSDGQYVWHVDGWPDFPEGTSTAGMVALEEITEEEYETLKAQLEEWGKVDDPEEEDPDETNEETEEEEQQERAMTPAEAAAKIKELTATVDELTSKNEMLEECLLDMSEIVYA
jgi:vacuolar-type H+-ATPase subunit I/STV1